MQFRYSKSFPFSTTILLSILLAIFLNRTFHLQDMTSIEIISLSDIFLFSLIIYIAFKYLLPAHREKIALELNEQGIVDGVRQRTIHWDTIQNVRLVRLYGVITPGIAIDLTNKNHFLSGRPFFQRMLGRLIDYSYRTPIVIPLQYISGDSLQIFESVKGYFVRRKNGA